MLRKLAPLVIVLAACNPEEEPLSLVLDVTDLAITPGELQADTTLTSIVSVRLDPVPVFEPRRVRFVTTIGSFVASDTNTVELFAATDGTASVALRHPQHPGSGLITAAVGSRQTTLPVSFVFNPNTEFASLAARDSAAADGTTIVTYVATLAETARPRTPQVRFTSTAGTFVGGTTSTDRSGIEVPVDGNGRALALLQAPTTPQVGAVTATATRSSITRTVTFFRPAITISVEHVAPTADGRTIVPVRTHVSDVEPGTIVHLRAVGGTLVGAITSVLDLPVGQDGTAIAGLLSSQAGLVVVTADVAGASARHDVEFVNAWPDFIRLTADALTVRAEATRTITVAVGRYIGTPTTGSVVTFEAIGGAGQPVGVITPSTIVQPGGTVPIQYSPGSTSYIGPVTIRARTLGSAGTVTADLTLEVLKKEGGE
jgi:hypothetical protein